MLDSWLPWRLSKQCGAAKARINAAATEAYARLETVRVARRRALDSIHRIDESGSEKVEQGNEPESARIAEGALDQPVPGDRGPKTRR